MLQNVFHKMSIIALLNLGILITLQSVASESPSDLSLLRLQFAFKLPRGGQSR